MNVIDWTPDLELDEAAMDATHREFVDLLNAVGAAADGELPGRLDAFLAHTEAHFGDENRRMGEILFPPAHCHRNEHENVLLIIRDVRGRVVAGDVDIGRVLATALGEWFRQHAATMDAVLAWALKGGRFETAAEACFHGGTCVSDAASPVPADEGAAAPA